MARAPDPALFEDLVRENQRFRRRIAELQKENEKLKELLEEARRSGKRQAAPFSRGNPNRNPKKPGRKRGKKYGRRGSRPVPKRPQIDETHEATLPSACPHCASEDIEETTVEHQYQVDIPRRPIHRQFNVQCSRGVLRYLWTAYSRPPSVTDVRRSGRSRLATGPRPSSGHHRLEQDRRVVLRKGRKMCTYAVWCSDPS